MSITMQQLAELAGVTRSAVSAVLNNSGGSRVSPEKRLRILELARKVLVQLIKSVQKKDEPAGKDSCAQYQRRHKIFLKDNR